MTGWIKLHRTILKHWIWSNPDYVKAWLTILLTVNHEEIKVLIHGELISCGRGQSILSLQSWAKLFGRKWTIQKVRTFFDLLKVDEMITTEGLRKTTRLTVCNYDTYQDDQQTDNRQRTDKEQTGNRQVTTNKNDKKEKKEKEINNMCILSNATCFSFEEFWKVYPNKTAKAEAEKKFAKLSEEDRLAIKNTMQSFINYVQFPGYKHPMPTTYFNQKRWKDFEQQLEVKPESKKPVNGTIDLSGMYKR